MPFIERGPNVKRGEINIRCPFCGSADPSFHMGISLETGWYSCWRNRVQHSGKSPVRLLMRLLRVPYGVAREMAGLGEDSVDPDGFDALAARLMGRDGAAGAPGTALPRRVLDLDPGFEPVSQRGRTRRHWDYLVEQRGFSSADVVALGSHYGVCAGVRGDWSDRVVLPYYLDGAVVTWTGRAIGASSMRYRDLARGESILPPKETLYNHDAMLGGGRALVVQEGPFDALKVDLYGREHGVRSVALSTNSATAAQAFLLDAAGHFERTVVMLDNAGPLGVVDSMRMRQQLDFLPNLSIEPVPFGAKDGADLTPSEIARWARTL